MTDKNYDKPDEKAVGLLWMVGVECDCEWIERGSRLL